MLKREAILKYPSKCFVQWSYAPITFTYFILGSGHKNSKPSGLDLWFINNFIMHQIECLFQSFEGAGSIFASAAPILTTEDIRRHTCRAIILINTHRKCKGETTFLSNLRQFSITADREGPDFSPLFHKASLFTSEARRTTNIMVWCPEDRELATVFVFAHLILRYGYSIDYIWRLYDRRITDIAISQALIKKLRNLGQNKSVQEETAKKLKGTNLEKRLLRIKGNYSELAKDSHRDWISQKNNLNPEWTSRRGLSETEFVVQSFESEASCFRERSSTGSAIKTHRRAFKSFF